MVQKPKPKKETGPPLLGAAILCSVVFDDGNNVLSLSVGRIIDEIRASMSLEVPPDTPSKANPVEINIWSLFIIRRGGMIAGKRYRAQIIVERPDGTRDDLFSQDMEFPEFPNRSYNLTNRLQLKLYTEGVHWIELLIADESVARTPLNLIVQRQAEPKK